MRCIAWTAMSVLGIAVSGCTDLTGDSYSSQGVYSSSGYYGGPAGYAPGYYTAPYPYQPGYVVPYGNPGFQGGRDYWQERDWRERRGNEFRNEGREQFREHHQNRESQMNAQPRSPAPRQMPQPPAAAPAQVEQNKRAIDQLGFRPSR